MSNLFHLNDARCEMPGLKTDWICVATAGKTVDGRDIKDEWLIDAAKNYDRSYYTAMIWPRHHRYYNLGLVDELKSEKANGVQKLYARLSPNDYLIQMNKEKQYLFSSIEIELNFAESGKTYMYGLAVTDTPASVGTDMLHFSKNEGIEVQEGNAEPLVLKEPSSFISRLFERFTTHPDNTVDEQNSEEQDMTKEQFEQLTGLLSKQDEKFSVLETKMGELEKQFSALSAGNNPDDGKNEKDPKPEIIPPSGDGDNNQFTQLMKMFEEQGKKTDALMTKFEVLEKDATRLPKGAPDADNVDNDTFV